jgi:hypothetical protein
VGCVSRARVRRERERDVGDYARETKRGRRRAHRAGHRVGFVRAKCLFK